MTGDLDVRVVLTAAADQLRKELAGVGGDVQGFGQRLSSGLSSAGERLVGLGTKMSLLVTGPLAALGGGMLGLVKSTADIGDQIAKTAKSVGIDAGSFQELEFALGQVTDLSEGEFARALQNLNQRMGQLADGGAPDQLTEAFGRLGISAKDIASGSVGIEEVFGRLNTELHQTDTAAGAASLASELLGERIGKSLGAQLRTGGAEVEALRDQYRDLGLVLSNETLDAAEQFSDQNSLMNRQFRALGTAIGGALLPVFVNDLMPFLLETAIPGLIKMAGAVGDLIRWFQDLPGPVKQTAGIVAAAIGVGGPILLALGAMATAFAAIITPVGAIGAIAVFLAGAGIAGWTAYGDGIKSAVGDAIAWLQETFTAFGEWWSGFWGGLFAGFRETFGAGFTFISETTTAVTEGVKSTFQGLGDYLIFRSLIPDMWDAIKTEWREGAAAIAQTSDILAGQTPRQFAGMVSASISQFQTMLAAWESHSQAMFIASRAAAIAQALIATFQGIAEALKWGWPLGPIFAGIIGGIGFAQVAAIAATSFGGGGGGGGSRGGGGSSGSSGLVSAAAAQPPAAPASSSSEREASRQEVVIDFGSNRTRYSRDEIELLLDQINEALDDNAVIRVR